MKRAALIAGVLVALAIVLFSLRATPVATLFFESRSEPKPAQRHRSLASAPAAKPEEKAPEPPPEAAARHRVCVEQEGGEALQDVGLSFYCSDSSALRAQARTDEQGCVALSLCPGHETVTCARLSAGRFRQGQAWILDPQREQERFVAKEARAIWGRIEDSTGQGVAGAKLWIEADDPDPLSPPLWVQSVLQSDAQGRYRWQAVNPAPCDPCLVDPEDCDVSRGQLALESPQPGQFWIRHQDFGLHKVEIPDRWGQMEVVALPPARAPISLRLSGLSADQKATLLLEHRQRRLDRQSQRVAAGQEASFRGLGPGLYDLSIYLDGKRVAQRKGLSAGDQPEIELAPGL